MKATSICELRHE